ncbi:SAM-dependent methyltransferase [Desulfopila sp. IMCC35008]|uniref:class I SAM-dependent methyltransferase n=1 Tax=Desulfopila sp. IMCC35008 TaxID=2653858 RepID=UPI0013D57030|nr:SAM-dependent methyltransferase [Desulfopila sp. IMCC35008]
MDHILPTGFVEATEKVLLASGVASKRVIRWSHSPRMVALYEWFDWLLPGQFEAFAYRKAFCEGQARMAIAAGAGQVLVLGAGYDMMAWRLASEFPDVEFFEIDHPATAGLKAKGVAEIGQPDNLTLISEDLGERNLVEIMQSDTVWAQSTQTVVIAEGLLMYLPSAAVKELFRRCETVTGPNSRIAFTYIPTGVDGRPDAGRCTGFMLWSLKMRGEPWLWSIRPEELTSFLKELGWINAPDYPETNSKYGVERFGVAMK